MAGFLGFGNFTKEGKGVRKDEPRKKGLSLYFELLTRKFGSYVKLNLMYFLTCIPSLIILNLVAYYLISNYIFDATGNITDVDLAIGAVMFAFIAGFFVTMLFSLSPFSSGYYYILRNFSEESHAWVWSDFMKHFKNNKKQSLITYFIDLLVSIIFMVGAYIYITLSFRYSVLWIPFAMFVIIGLVYALTATYRWTMIVTIELNLKNIYKNAFLLVLGELLTTLKYIVAMALYLGVYCLLFSSEGLAVLGFILCVLLGFSGLGLIQQINFFPVIKKYFLEGKTINEIIEETVAKENEEI